MWWQEGTLGTLGTLGSLDSLHLSRDGSVAGKLTILPAASQQVGM